MTAPESMLRMLKYVFRVRPSALLELTLAQANCITRNVSGRLNLGLSTREVYGFFVAEEKQFLRAL